MSDNAISEIATAVQERQAGFKRPAVDRNVVPASQASDALGNIGGRNFVAARQNPSEFAQGYRTEGDNLCARQRRLREFGLTRIIACKRPH